MELYGKPNIKREVELHSSPEKQKATGGPSRESKRKRTVKFFQKHFPDAKKVLCIGSRNFKEPATFAKAGYDAVGIDVCIEDRLVRRIDAHDIETTFGENEFDIAYACHSFEHFHDPHRVFNGIRKVVKDGLYFIIPLGKGARITEDHACLYDVMRERNHTLEKLKQRPELLADFAPLGPFELIHVNENWLKNKHKNEGELEMCLRFLR